VRVALDNPEIFILTNNYFSRLSSFQAGKKWHHGLLAGLTLAFCWSALLPTNSIASKSRDLQIQSTAANYLAARQALYFKDFKASADFYLTALSFDHNNVDLLKQAFYAQYQLGNIEAAATLAREMELLNISGKFASEPATAQAILTEDWDAVLVLADLIAEDIDAKPLAAIIRAWALVAKGQGAAGLSHLIKSRNANITGNKSAPVIFTMQAARMANYLGDADEMLKLADQLFKRDDLSSQLLLQLASLYARHDKNIRFGQLIAKLPNGFDKIKIRKVLSDQKTSLEIAHHIAAGVTDLSLISHQSKNSNMLKARLGLALYLNPQSDRARFLLAQALSEMNQTESAKEQLAAIDQTGAWGQPRLLLEVNLDRSDNVELAISRLQNSLDEDQKNAFLQKELGDLYRVSDQLNKARDAYLMAISLGLSSATLDRNLAISYEQLEEDHLAEDSFQKALKKNPRDPFTLNYLGYWWADEGRNLEDAIDLIERAVRLRPRSGYFVDSLGWVHFKLGNLDLAVAFLEQATILEPVDPVISDHLGDAYWATGRFIEARFKWQYALSITDDDDLKAKITAKLTR
jgi:tetratricopeptide (TPR) repeat protein